jgi:hypothetical protein
MRVKLNVSFGGGSAVCQQFEADLCLLRSTPGGCYVLVQLLTYILLSGVFSLQNVKFHFLQNDKCIHFVSTQGAQVAEDRHLAAEAEEPVVGARSWYMIIVTLTV